MREFLKNGLPHVLVIGLFVILAAAYFSPVVFDNKELLQGDVKSGIVMGKDLKDYHQKTNVMPFGRTGCLAGCRQIIPICLLTPIFLVGW